MKFRLITTALATTLIASTLAPALAAGPVTLTGFAAGKSVLTTKHQSQLRALAGETDVIQIGCVGLTKAKPSASEKSLATSRAKSACNFLGRIHPAAQLRSSIVAGKSSDVGKVRVSLVTKPKEVEVAIPEVKSPFEEPFPTTFTKTELIDRSLSEVKKFVAAQTRSTQIDLAYQETFPQRERAWIDLMVKFLGKAIPADNSAFTPFIAVGSSDDYIVAEAEKRGLQYFSPGFCGRVTRYESYCASLGWAGLNYKDSVEGNHPIVDPGKRSVLAHEYFHVWHKSIDGSTSGNNKDPRSPEGIPLWFMEGNANFFGFALTHTAELTSYSKGRQTQVDEYMKGSSEPLSAHIGWDLNPYGIGQASAEYLVASVGVEKVLDVYRKLGQGFLFADAFKSSIGISLDEYYAKFELARASIQR